MTTDMTTMKRIIAVHIDSKTSQEEATSAIKTDMSMINSQVFVFAPANIKNTVSIDDSQWIVFPEETDSIPKQKNFILRYFANAGFRGFLHLVESDVKFTSHTEKYIDKLETTMQVLDYDVHLSTTTDKCNYIFNKFCPRLSLDIDDDIIKSKLRLPDKLSFTSHSNVSCIAFNFNTIKDISNVLFDERFTVGMFFIIEFLARRRANRRPDQLYYMNQYLSIGDELGAYDMSNNAFKPDIDQDTMNRENELFKSLNINYAPDNNIDIVLDALYNKLKAKMNAV